jgi:hypothetical protein
MNRIDLIIDALSVAQNSVWSKRNEEALAAARELKALQPVAAIHSFVGGVKHIFYLTVSKEKKHENDILLYALDEYTK